MSLELCSCILGPSLSLFWVCFSEPRLGVAAGILTLSVVSGSTWLLLLASGGGWLAIFHKDSCWELPGLAELSGLLCKLWSQQPSLYCSCLHLCPGITIPAVLMAKPLLALADSLAIRGLTCWRGALKDMDSWRHTGRDADLVWRTGALPSGRILTLYV